MPEQTESRSARPILKLRSVSMRAGPPILPARDKATSNPVPAPGIPSVSLPSALGMNPPALQGPAGENSSRESTNDSARPAFTHWQTERPSGPAQQDAGSVPFLPRIRHRLLAMPADSAMTDPPPTPALALRLRQFAAARHAAAGQAVATRGATPFQILDQAVRLRLWDVVPARRLKPPPTG